MRSILRQGQRFERQDLPAEKALERLRETGEPYKLEYARELIDRGRDRLSFYYTNDPFFDLCEGPHVDDTRGLPVDAFKLHSVAGAYWRGDEANVMMTRIYGYAYRTKQELRRRIEEVEQARRRDHRKLARKLGIYAVADDVGHGLPLWLPNGTVIRRELEKLAYEMEFQAGYRPVTTPHIARADLYTTSGHLPLYEDVMYPRCGCTRTPERAARWPSITSNR